ncbi:uncharacterized protein RHOBADRAFT_13767 [Rhodotorula graminis WP1]|uniref:CTLH domain-containing protein n=1 Tax=Rhodotorula graminis (strain WP1) TaxID=578459 RepID=A0A194S4V8_RHOGW|nr:uncharacterized protein RHOBADRAFT_13767 [Rhodotorula graminis WP1]KPV75622.1 hypothetical protein RHOBADRAFT_13767 [Rhodotorula graminis WP1]
MVQSTSSSSFPDSSSAAPSSTNCTSPDLAINGTTSAASATNGHVAVAVKDAAQYEGDEGFVPLWEGSNLDRREFVRIALQAFQDMGYSNTAQALQAESGFSLEPAAVALFRQGVLDGQWTNVEQRLSELPIDPSFDLTPVKFAIRQQKFLEALEARETKTALSVLRNELSPLNHDSNRLHFLSSLVMCMSADDLRARARWDGASGSSRQRLLVQLQDFISPTVMLPQRRLATLFAQAQAHQQRHHALPPSADEPFSLLVDADPNGVAGFPTYTTHVLQEHTDEVWRVQWSHDGEWLATAGKDRTAMIWRVQTGFTLDKVFRNHADPVSCLAWSPDDSILLTAAEAVIKMWNTETGSCIATLVRHEYAIGALAWLPDGRGFVSGGMDSKLFFWDLAGNVISHLARCPSRVVDLAISPDGTKLVCVGRADTTEPHLVPSRHSSRSVVQPQELSSVTISSDSRYAIVTHAPKEIVYVDLEDGTIVRRFEGHDIGKFVVRACFGGASDNFILSGSADGKVYVYHRDTGRLLHALGGHERTTVNAVAWNAKAPGGGPMWASCSDDRTVRVWGMPPPSSSPAGGENGASTRRGPRLRPLDRAMRD